MKGKYNRILSVVLAAVVAFGTFAVCTTNTFAASKWIVDVENPIYVDNYGGVWVYNDTSFKDAKVVNVTSSAPKICKVDKGKYDDGTKFFNLIGIKKGKAKISVTYKTPKGTKVTKTKTVTVKPYPNMIKSLKINNKSVSTNAKKNSYVYKKEGYKKTKVNIKMIPAKGWKISNVYGYAYKYEPWKSKELKLTKSMVTGEKTISFSGTYNELDVHVTLVNKKNGSHVDYGIDLFK